MTMITTIPTAWSAAVTLVRDEIWQARNGAVFLSTTANPVAKDGLLLKAGDGLRLASGLKVKYRKEGTGTPLIVREGV